MELESFYRSLCESRDPAVVQIDGRIYRAKYKPGRGKRLIVLFHPAQPAHSPNRPYFLPFLSVDAPQLSITDPTLEGYNELTSGWYLGNCGRIIPDLLSAVLIGFSDFIGAVERIYVGGSSGGYAALLYSVLDPRSLAIAACPQVDLDTYGGPGVEYYRTAFMADRPHCKIKDFTGIDLINSYSEGFLNSAIIIISSGDYGHLYGQVVPLLRAIRPENRDQIVLNSNFYGVRGHGGSIPSIAYASWVRAALSSQSLVASEIMSVHHVIESTVASPQTINSDRVKRSVVDADDLKIASILREYQLRQESER